MTKWNNLQNIKQNILISLQWGMGLVNLYPDQHLIDQEVIPFALKNIILDTHDSYNWIFRLHPVQLLTKREKSIARYLNSNFGHLNLYDWHQTSIMPLPFLLKHVDLHITYNSSVTKEAAFFGVRTALLDPQIGPGGIYCSYYREEIKLGLAQTLLCTEESIRKWLRSSYSSTGRSDPTSSFLLQNYTDFLDQVATMAAR
jgi:hypothetical protein